MERRGHGPITAAALVVASMIGSGVFTTSGFALADLGDPRYVLWAWVLGGLSIATFALSLVWVSFSWSSSRRRPVTPPAALRTACSWCPDSRGSIPGAARLAEARCAFPWDDPATDRRDLSGQIAAEREAIEHDDLDLEQLEEGVHERRRRIRWFPIYLFPLSGFAALDDSLDPIPGYEPLLRGDAAKSKVAALAASSRATSPNPVFRSPFIANSVYVGELGDLEDDGQTSEGLAFALRKSGVKQKASRAEQKAVELMDLEPARMHAIHERSAAIDDEMKCRRRCHHLAGVRCRGTESAAVRSRCPHR